MSNLEKYSKQEIIEAILSIGKYYDFRLEETIVAKIKENHRQKVHEKANAARNNEIDCMNEYLNWQKEMITKYGKDGKCPLGNIPKDELAKGVRLSTLWTEAQAKRTSLEKKENSYYRSDYEN